MTLELECPCGAKFRTDDGSEMVLERLARVWLSIHPHARVAGEPPADRELFEAP